MKRILFIVFFVLFTISVKSQHVETVNGGIIFTKNHQSDLSYNGFLPGLMAGFSLNFPSSNHYGLELVFESNLKYWSEAIKRDHYERGFICSDPCSVYEQSALSATTEVGFRKSIFILSEFDLTFLTGLNYEMRFFNNPNFGSSFTKISPYNEFKLGLLGKAKLSSFLTDHIKLYISWQYEIYDLMKDDSPTWLFPTFSAGLAYSLNP